MQMSLRELRDLARVVGDEQGIGLADSLSIVRYEPNRIVYKSGDTFDGVNIIVRGIVKTVSCIDGRSIIPALMVPGDVMGSEAFYSGTHFNETVTSSEVDAIAIPSKAFDLMIENSAYFRAYLSDSLARALAQGALMINLLANARAEVRVIFYLLKIFSAMSTGKLQPSVMDLGLSRSEIGDFLGLNRETVSRKLTSLAACGLIRLVGQRVEVRDLEALKRICGHIMLQS